MPEPAPATSESTTTSPSLPSPALWPTPRQAFVILIAYFAIQVVLRVAFSASVDLDESEQIVLGQKLCLGYGSDPPLYTWIQIPFFSVFGESVLALSLLKNLLLLSIYWLTFLCARLLTRSTAAAVAAAFSLLFLPEVAWESQRDLTHTILSAVVALGSLYCLLQIFETRANRWYVWFGVSIGLGVLSKYNYAFWLVGLILAGISMPELRPALLDRRMLVALAMGICIFLPNGLWMLAHRNLALLTASKFDVRQSYHWFHAVRLGSKNLAQSIVGFGAPLLLIFGLVFWSAPASQQPTPPTGRQYRTLILRAWLIVGATLLVLVVFARATGFKERWFQPILIALPVAAISFAQRRLDAIRLKLLVGLAITVMFVIAVVMPGRLLAAERLKREEPLERPYAEITAQIHAAVPPGSLVVCDTRLLAGNLRLGLPANRVLPTELVPLMGGAPEHSVVAWDATKDIAMPDDLRRWIVATGHTPSRYDPKFFTARYHYHHAKQFRLGLLQLY